jgi:hypothetical protein
MLDVLSSWYESKEQPHVMMRKKNRVLLILGIGVAAFVRTLWKKSEQKSSDLRESVNTWENEGGQVPGVSPTRTGR